MAKKYTVTIPVRVWKEHPCVSCGAAYAYELRRQVSATASSAAQAEAQAKSKVMGVIKHDVDEQPCPTCGLLQPNMVGQRRAVQHGRASLAAAFAVLLLFILYATDTMQSTTATLAFITLAALIGAWHLAGDIANPNGKLESNRRMAVERVANGAVRHVPGREGAPPLEHLAPRRSRAHVAAMAVVSCAVVIVALPEIIRVAQSWPANLDSHPPVIGPGDAARIYMRDHVTSVKGYWSGHPTVSLRTKNGKSFPVVATSHLDSWGSTITAKSSEHFDSSLPWVDVTIPSSAELSDEDVVSDISLDVDYPAETSPASWQVMHTTLRRADTLQLSPSGAGALYGKLWMSASLIGLLVLLGGGLLLRHFAVRLERSAPEARVYT